jgi:hypothetical protein
MRRLASVAAGILTVVLLLSVAASCSRGGSSERVTLPPTAVLSIRKTWAVVRSPLLRVRDDSTSQSTVLSHIRMGAVMEVLTRSDKEDIVENETAYWYRIDFQGLKGWVFGSYIEIFDTRAKADLFAATLK